MIARYALLPLALPLFLPGAPSGDTIAFVPREGLVLRKTFEMRGENEQETSSDQGMGGTSAQSQEQSLVVIDRVIAADGERVTSLRRLYDDLATETESSYEFGDHGGESTVTGTSELTGSTVEFEWDEDDESYTASSDEVDDEHLEELRYDLDFGVLLPEGEVEEGDEWELDVDELRAAFDPWRSIPWDYESSDGESFHGGDMDDAEQIEPEVEESTDGEVTATYAGTREVDGVRVAVIELEGEIEYEAVTDQRQDFDQGSVVMHQETRETRSLEGEALWNVEGGHLHSISLEVERSGSATMESTYDFGGQEFSSSSESDTTGTSTFSVEFEVVEEDE